MQTIPQAEPDADVLIIDDSREMCRLLRTLLRLAGHSAESVCSGSDAIDRLQHRPFRLVLMEWELPDVHASNVIRFARARESADSIVIYTASSDDAARDQALDAGATDFVPKGNGWDALYLQHLRRHLS